MDNCLQIQQTNSIKALEVQVLGVDDLNVVRLKVEAGVLLFSHAHFQIYRVNGG